MLQAVALALACLSYDFVGTSMDDSSEDLGTIQVSFSFTLLAVTNGPIRHGYSLNICLLLDLSKHSIEQTPQRDMCCAGAFTMAATDRGHEQSTAPVQLLQFHISTSV